MQDEIERNLNATVSLVQKVGKTSKIDCLLGILMIALGVALLVSPTEGSMVLDINTGIAMTLIGISDLVVAIRMKRKMKE